MKSQRKHSIVYIYMYILEIDNDIWYEFGQFIVLNRRAIEEQKEFDSVNFH